MRSIEIRIDESKSHCTKYAVLFCTTTAAKEKYTSTTTPVFALLVRAGSKSREAARSRFMQGRS